MNSFIAISNLIYLIIEEHGQGRNSRVYKTRDPQFLSDMVAVKSFRLSGGQTRKNQETAFYKKIKKLAGLKGTNLPQIIDFTVQGEYAYVVMSWLEGEKLPCYIDKQASPLTVRQIIRMIIHLAEYLKTYHNYDPLLIHGDIKPDNIIVDSKGTPQLADVFIEWELSGINLEIAQHPGFKAPESILGRQSAASDIYSLCAVAYYLLTGHSPSDFPPFCYPPVQKFLPQLHDMTAAVIEKGLSYDLETRYREPDGLIEDLNRCLSLLPPESPLGNYIVCPFCAKSGKPSDLICGSCGLDTGIFLGDNQPESYFHRGIHQFDTGNAILAERFFYQALRLGYNEPEVLTHIALCSYLEGKVETSENMLRNILIRFPDNPSALAASARILYESGMKSAAIEMLMWGEKANPGNAEIIGQIADYYYQENEMLKALNTLHRVSDDQKNDKGIPDIKVKVLKKAGRIKELDAFVDSIPPALRTAGIAFLYGKLKLKQGNLRQAFRFLLEAQTKEPFNPYINLILAENYSKMGASGEAVLCCINAARSPECRHEAIKQAVFYFSSSDNPENVLPFLYYLIRSEQVDAADYLKLGIILVRNNFSDDGIKYLEKYTNLEAQDPAGWEMLKEAWIKKGDKDKALEAAKIAVGLQTKKRLGNK